MATWIYKATMEKAGLEFTRMLALDDHFLVRTAYIPTSHAKAPNAWKVAEGDVLHLYFGAPERCALGSFRIGSAANSGGRFVAAKRAAFVEVRDSTLIRRLDEAGRYAPDPLLKRYVGWFLEPASEQATPPFEDLSWPDRATLVRIG